MSARNFKVVMSERCFRFKPDALPSHAPQHPGVYEFVTFNEKREPVVLYIGVAMDSLYESISAHMTGKSHPNWDELFGAAKDVYFDYVASSDIETKEELKDIAGFLINKHKPRLNTGDVPSSGKHAAITVEEID